VAGKGADPAAGSFVAVDVEPGFTTASTDAGTGTGAGAAAVIPVPVNWFVKDRKKKKKLFRKCSFTCDGLLMLLCTLMLVLVL
jgi:hypothetical protein